MPPRADNSFALAAKQLWQRAEPLITDHPQAFMALTLVSISVLALWSRYRFIAGQYTYTLSSGDVQLTMLKALLVSKGIVEPSPELIPTPAIFDQPPFIPLLFAGLMHITDMPLRVLPFIVVPLLTTAMLLAFFDITRRMINLPTALLGTVLLALLPRFSFDSTEAEKAPFVISFAVIALWLLVVSNGRNPGLFLAGALLGLSMFSHVTGYFFAIVFVSAFLYLRGFAMRSLVQRDFLIAMMVPMLALLGYAGLSFIFAQDTAAQSADAAGGGIIPGFVQRYAETIAQLAGGAFHDSAWNTYFEAIRHQLTTPVYIAAIAGLGLAIFDMIRNRRGNMSTFVVWMVLMSVGFGIQYPAASHASRYPSYATPAFVVMASFAVVQGSRLVMQALPARPIALALVAMSFGVIIAWPAYTYATASDPGLRKIYGGYRDVAVYIHEERLLEDGSHVLYLGWPSITLELLDADIEYQDQLHTFGFGLRDLDTLTPAYIEENNIRYYIDTQAGSDGFDSSTTILGGLQDDYWLVHLARFERKPGNYAVLHRLEPAHVSLQEGTAWRTMLDERAADLELRSLVSNPTLQWNGDDLPGWQPNGVVDIGPVRSNIGVYVRNLRSYGGIRQAVPQAMLDEGWITFVTEIRRPPVDAAESLVLAIGPAHAPPVAQLLGPIDEERTVVLLEARLDHVTDDLRFTIATGVNDEGDLIVERAYVLPGRSDEVVAQYGSLSP